MAERFYAKAEIELTEPFHKIELDLTGLDPSLHSDPQVDVHPGTQILKVSGDSPSPFQKGDKIPVKFLVQENKEESCNSRFQ
jgi:hypothetical protein